MSPELFWAGDVIDLYDVTATSDNFSGGVLTVENGASTVAIPSFAESFAGQTFALSSDGQGGADIELTATPSPSLADRQTAQLMQAIVAQSSAPSAIGEFRALHRSQGNAIRVIAAQLQH